MIAFNIVFFIAISVAVFFVWQQINYHGRVAAMLKHCNTDIVYDVVWDDEIHAGEQRFFSYEKLALDWFWIPVGVAAIIVIATTWWGGLESGFILTQDAITLLSLLLVPVCYRAIVNHPPIRRLVVWAEHVRFKLLVAQYHAMVARARHLTEKEELTDRESAELAKITDILNAAVSYVESDDEEDDQQ